MASELIVGALINIACSGAWDATKFGVAKSREQSLLTKAIAMTASTFSEIENCSDTLYVWCRSSDFQSLLFALNQGLRDVADTVVIERFIEATDFFMGAETEQVAQDLLSVFAKSLEEQLYRSPAGIQLLGERLETLSAGASAERNHNTQTLLNAINTYDVAVANKLDDQAAVLDEIRRSVTKGHQEDQEQKYRSYYSTLEHSNRLINEGQPAAARVVLSGILSDLKDQDVPPILLYRVQAQLAFCAYRLDDYTTAQQHFTLALQNQTPTVKTMTLQAVAALLRGETQKAAEYCRAARLMESINVDATALYLQVLDMEGDILGMEQLLVQDPWIASDPRCALTLGRIRFGQGIYDQAESFLRIALTDGERDPLACMELALTLFAPVLHEFRADPRPTWQATEDEHAMVREAEELLTEAVEQLRRHDNPAMLHTALVNRSAVRALMGRFHEAIKDCDRVLLDNDGADSAWQNKANALMHLGQYTDAISCYEKVVGTEAREAVRLPLAYAYSQAEQWDKVIGMLEPVWGSLKDTPSSVVKLRVADILMIAYHKEHLAEATAELFELLATCHPDDAEALCVLARQRRREERDEEAIALFQKAMATAQGNLRLSVQLDYALLYFYRGDYAEAAELFRPYVDNTRDDVVLPMFITSLVNSGALKEALARAQEARGTASALPIISEAEAFVLEYVGDLDKARNLDVRLSEIEDNNPMHLIRAALLAYRCGETDEACRLIGNIRRDHIRQNPRVLMQLAQIRATLGMPDVLPLAYEARRLAPTDPNIQVAYFGVFVGRDQAQDGSLDVDEVTVDTTVRLRNGHRESVFTIVADGTTNLQPNEFPFSHSTARLVLGRRTGDSIALSDGPFGEINYEVAEIRSKYVAAFQEIATEYQTRFPDQPGIHQMEVQGQDFSGLFSMLDARENWFRQAQALYQERKLPLSALAELVNETLIDTWHHMIGRADGVLLVADGDTEKMDECIKILKQADGMVLDLTAILALKYLGLLDRLSQRFTNLWVAQAVLDDISQALNAARQSMPHMTVARERGQYLRQEVTPEDIQKRINFLEELRASVRSNTQVVPVYGMLDLPRKQFEELSDLVGRSAFASILLAKERDLPLASDDLGLRAFAANDWKVSGCWTQAITTDLHAHNIIGKSEKHDIVRKFAVSHFRHTLVDIDDVMWILERNGLSPTTEVVTILSLFDGQNCDQDAAVSVLSEIVKCLWLKPLLPYQSLLLLDQILRALVSGRNDIRVIEQFKKILRIKFRLLPAHLPMLLSNIDLWTQQRVHAIQT